MHALSKVCAGCRWDTAVASIGHAKHKDAATLNKKEYVRISRLLFKTLMPEWDPEEAQLC